MKSGASCVGIFIPENDGETSIILFVIMAMAKKSCISEGHDHYYLHKENIYVLTQHFYHVQNLLCDNDHRGATSLI